MVLFVEVWTGCGHPRFSLFPAVVYPRPGELFPAKEDAVLSHDL